MTDVAAHLKETYNTLANGLVGERLRNMGTRAEHNIVENFPFLGKQPQDVTPDDMLSVAMGGITILPGAKSFSADMANKAEDMLREGVSPKDVWRETKYARAYNSEGDRVMYTTRIDPEAKLDAKAPWRKLTPNDETMPLREVMSSPVFDDEYPGVLDDLQLYNTGSKDYSQYIPGTNFVGLGTTHGLQSALHETDHVIQDTLAGIEGGGPALTAKMMHLVQRYPDGTYDTSLLEDMYGKQGQMFAQNLKVHGPEDAAYAQYRAIPGEALAKVAETRLKSPTYKTLQANGPDAAQFQQAILDGYDVPRIIQKYPKNRPARSLTALEHLSQYSGESMNLPQDIFDQVLKADVNPTQPILHALLKTKRNPESNSQAIDSYIDMLLKEYGQ